MLNTKIGSTVLISNYQKKGSTVGRAPNKLTYGDDVVNITLEIVDYISMVKEEILALENADLQLICDVASQRGYTCWEGRGAKAVERSLTLDDLSDGMRSLIEKKERSLANDEQDDRYEYLATGVKQHIETGAVYVQGIVTDEQVIVPSENGPAPHSKSSGKVVAEKVIARILNLRSRKWRQYDLSKGDVTVIS